MSLSTIWYHRFRLLGNIKISDKREKVRFVEKAGKLA